MFALLIFSFSQISNNLVSLRPNYFIFIGYLKMGGGGGLEQTPSESPLDLPLYQKIFLIRIATDMYLLNGEVNRN